MKNNLKGKTRRALSLILLLSLLTGTLCACSAAKTSQYTLSPDIISSKKSLSLSSTTTGATKSGKISSSGMTTLFIDRKTASPIIKNQNVLWRALPKSTASNSDEIPAVLTVELLKDGQRYVLNSQSDGVKNAAPVLTKTDGGVYVEYAMSLETEGESIRINVPVTFYLEDGNFFASVKCSEISVSDKDFVVTKLRLLDYFGSNTAAVDGDYILVPDNSGAVIDTFRADSSFENVSLKVYGDSEKNNAVTGAFGMKRKDSAFIAMIEEGDAIASIGAQTAAHTGYNRVGTEFEITETLVRGEGENEKIFVSGESYDGEIRICYRFIEGNNANYSGMAIACREHLIRTGVLSSDTVEESGELPFVLSTVGAATDSLKISRNLTSYEQLLDMLTYLKGKGFPNIYIRYKGMLSGGFEQNDISKCQTLPALGTQEQFKELTDYVSAQQMKLFVDLGINSCTVTAAKGKNLAGDLTGEKYSAPRINLLGGGAYFGFTAYDRIDDNVISIFSLAKNGGFRDLCINDASAFLYSDSKNGATRTDVMQMIENETASLSTIGSTMVEKGNFYMLKNASVIASLPLTASAEESGCYKSVPFIPLVLHGTVEYSSEPLNLSTDYQTSLLKCVEYGALPQFEWVYEDIEIYLPQNETQEETNQAAEENDADETALEEGEDEAASEEEAPDKSVKPYSYSDWATDAYTFYDRANKALGNIRDSRMTAHYEVQEGVFCTEYGESSVYVNYTSEDVTIGGVTVPANDFMRVN